MAEIAVGGAVTGAAIATGAVSTVSAAGGAAVAVLQTFPCPSTCGSGPWKGPLEQGGLAHLEVSPEESSP